MVFFLILLLPLVGLGIDLAHAVLAGSVDIPAALLLSPRRSGLLAASIGLAAAVAGCGILIGTVFVSGLSRIPQKTLFGIFIIMVSLAAVPPYIHALTWSEVFVVLNGIIPWVPVSGWLVSFWVELMALVPIAVFLSWMAFASVDSRLVDAARLVCPDMTVFRRIILPLAAPALGAAFGFLFLISCTDYSVPSLFSADVYALDIFAQFSATNSAATAFLFALPLLLVTFGVMVTCRSGIRTLAQIPSRLFFEDHREEKVYPEWFLALQTGAAFIILIQILVLFSGLVLATGSMAAFLSSVFMARAEFSYTLLTVILAILISLPLALAGGHALKKPGTRGALAWVIVLIPLAIPAPLIGIGILPLLNLAGLSGGPAALVFPAAVAVIKFSPLAAIVLFVQIRMIDPLLFDAASVFSKNPLSSLTRVYIPLYAPGLVVSAGILGALTMAELGATLIVAPPGHATITMRIYNYLHYGASADVAGLCLMVTLLTLAGSIVSLVVLRSVYRNFREAPRQSGDTVP